MKGVFNMTKMEPYVKKWYDYLEEGKIMGLKCKKCGAYEFPPVPVCNKCSSYDLEWTTMKGTGKLVSFSIYRFLDPVSAKYGPRIVGQVELDEGSAFTASLEGWDMEKGTELYDMLPVPVDLEIIQRDLYKFVAFRIRE